MAAAIPAGNEFHQGDAVHFDVTVYQDDDETTVKDVSGATVAGTIGLKKTGEAALAAGLPVVGSVEDGPAGLVRFSLTEAQTLLISPRDYDVQVRVTIDDEEVCVVDEKFRVHRRISDS